MRRLPWTSYAGHGHGNDEGGMEHLETDVMRFMAILAFCLVAIFALVQSMPLDAPRQTGIVEVLEPLAPAAVVAAAPSPAPPITASPSSTSQTAVAPAPESSPPPAAATVKPPAPTELVLPSAAPPTPPAQSEPVRLVMPARGRPVAKPSPQRQVAAPEKDQSPVAVAAPPTPNTSQRGFSLRFDSDDALRELVSRDKVALYAIDRNKAWRAMLVSQRLSFRPAQVPTRIHEMTAATVPDDVVKTLRRLVTVSPDQLKWGVTLPAATSQQLSEFVAAHDAGGLVIDAAGNLRLERG